MSEISPNLVIRLNFIGKFTDMAKYNLNMAKSPLLADFCQLWTNLTEFWAELLTRHSVFRCKLFGYQYSEIIRSLMCVYFCGGTCIEDLSKHLIPCVSQQPKLRTCSSDTILRAIEELTEDNISYTSDNGKTYEFNKAEKLNTLLLEALLTTGQLTKGFCLTLWHVP